MRRKNTDDLHQEICEASTLNGFLAGNEAHFCREDALDYLGKLFAARKLSKAELARRARMSEIYLHQIFAGRRRPSRSRLICICYALGANEAETQELLKLCGLAQLYPMHRRDAIILYGLIHGLELQEINDRLFAEDEETLY